MQENFNEQLEFQDDMKYFKMMNLHLKIMKILI
jgi:hypothetical protein